MKNKNLSWRDCQNEEPEEVSPIRCLLGAAGIATLALVMFILLVVGLSCGIK